MKLWDLGLVVPLAVVVGAGLVRHRSWALRPAYALVAGYLLLGCAVAGMGWAMVLLDAGGSVPQAVVVTAIVVALIYPAVRLYRPLFALNPRAPAARRGQGEIATPSQSAATTLAALSS